jgi:hypothetical protein
MGRIIVRVRGIDRLLDRRIRIGHLIREGIGLREAEEMLGVVLVEGVLVVALVVRREGMPGIGLVGVRRELLEGIGLGGMRVRVGIVRVGLLRAVLEEDGLVGVRGMLCREGRGLREMRGRVVRQPMRVDLRRIMRGLRGILMRDFRRVGIDRKGSLSNGRKGSRSRGRRDSLNSGLSNGLSRDHSRRVLDRVVLAGIIMPERRGPRAIVEDPVLVAVVGSEEVGSDEIARSGVDVSVGACGTGGLWLGWLARAGCWSEDVSYVS